MRSWLLALCLGGVTLGWPCAASEARAATRTVAVLTPRVSSSNVAVDRGRLAERLRDALSRVLPRGEFEVLSDEAMTEGLRGALRECTQESCEPDLGQRLGVDLLVASDVSEYRGRASLRLRLYDVYREERLTQDLAEGVGADAMLAGSDAAVERLVRVLTSGAAGPVAGGGEAPVAGKSDVASLTGDKLEAGGHDGGEVRERYRVPGYIKSAVSGTRGSVDPPRNEDISRASDDREEEMKRQFNEKVPPPAGCTGCGNAWDNATRNEAELRERLRIQYEQRHHEFRVRNASSAMSADSLGMAEGDSTAAPPGDVASLTGDKIEAGGHDGGEVRERYRVPGYIKSAVMGTRGSVDPPKNENLAPAAGVESQSPDRRRPPGTGTGFALSARHVITNAHVVADADRMNVIASDGIARIASVIGRDESQDLAVLELSESAPPMRSWLRLARAATGEFARAGQKVFVLGYPLPSMLGKDVVITEGIVNSRSGMQGDSTYFQMSVPIQPGNSGSPVLSDQGHVVGVVSASLRSTKLLEKKGVVAQNVNFAIKSNMLVEVFPWLLKKIPGDEVRQSYFEHLASDGADASTKAPPEDGTRAWSAEQVVARCAPSVVKILPFPSEPPAGGSMNAGMDCCPQAGLSDADAVPSDASTATLADVNPESSGYVVRGALMWLLSDLDGAMSFEGATSAAATCRVGGYSDWRLPSAFEIQTLYDPARASRVQFIDGWHNNRPTTAQIHVVAPLRLRAPIYWTTAEGRSEDTAWNFDFRNGEPMDMSQRRGKAGVLLVRRAH